MALHDGHTTLDEVLKAVQSFIKCKGRLWMIYSASRLQYVLHELEIANFQAKRIRFIHGMIDKPAKTCTNRGSLSRSGWACVRSHH